MYGLAVTEWRLTRKEVSVAAVSHTGNFWCYNGIRRGSSDGEWVYDVSSTVSVPFSHRTVDNVLATMVVLPVPGIPSIRE